MKKLIIALSLLFSLSCLFASDFKINYKSFRLKNGLKVLLVPKEDSSLVSVQVYYNVGGINETPKYLGVAHFLEHMMFKTSKNLKAGQYSYIVKSKGGYDNASTSYEYTKYYNILPFKEIETGLKLEAERMHNLTFVKKEFNHEKQVVLEERHNRYENSPQGYLWAKANAIFFKKHVYGRPVIGTEKSIKRINIKAMSQFYSQFYNPSNATLIVSGKINVEEAQKLIYKYFSKIKRKAFHKNVPKKRDFTPPSGFFKFRKKMNGRYAMTLTKIPSAKSKMTPALLVLDYLLFQGKSSVLKKELILKRRLCYALSGGNYLRRMPSAFIFSFIPAPNVSERTIYRAYLKALKNMLRQDLSASIKKAKLFILTGFYQELETAKGMGSSLGWSQIIASSPDFGIDLYQKASKVNEKAVKNAIRLLLNNPKATFFLIPKN